MLCGYFCIGILSIWNTKKVTAYSHKNQFIETGNPSHNSLFVVAHLFQIAAVTVVLLSSKRFVLKWLIYNLRGVWVEQSVIYSIVNLFTCFIAFFLFKSMRVFVRRDHGHYKLIRFC